MCRSFNADICLTHKQIKDLEQELEGIKATLEGVKAQLESETLSKVDLQNNIQSLREDLAFKKKMYEEVSCSNQQVICNRPQEAVPFHKQSCYYWIKHSIVVIISSAWIDVSRILCSLVASYLLQQAAG